MHNCLSGCIVRCSNIVHDKNGNYVTSALEFETLTLLGANCAVKTARAKSPLHGAPEAAVMMRAA